MTVSDGRAGASRSVAVPQTLEGLRRRLTAWYASTFLVILFLLGIEMFAVITRRFDLELDESLRVADANIEEVAGQRGIEGAFQYLRIPGRYLAILDTNGHRLSGAAMPEWTASLARRAWTTRADAGGNHAEPDDQILRAVARPVVAARGAPPYVAVAIADEIELEDRYTSLIVQFAVAALVAVILGTIGGWLVARQSTVPVERAIEHMRRFMADAAHELRTPLTVVRSRAEVALQRSRSADEYAEALRGIERETQRLGGIVEDLLMLARADAGQRPLVRQRVFLDDVTLDAAEAARVIAERKSVRLEVDSFEEAAVDGDPALLRQLVLILLDNAVKYTEPGGRVRVSVGASNGRATLRVSDTGIGISPEQLEHVFERFYRGDPSRTRGTGTALSEGAGLGLSIAQWIAAEHGATIEIASQPGHGTTVTVGIPSAAESLSST